MRLSPPVGTIACPLTRDLVGALELPVLPLPELQPLALRTRQPGTLAGVTLGTPNPLAQRLGRAADLRGNRLHRRPLRTVLMLLLEHHVYRPLLNLCRKLRLCSHCSILSSNGASGKAGAVQE